MEALNLFIEECLVKHVFVFFFSVESMPLFMEQSLQVFHGMKGFNHIILLNFYVFSR